MMSETLQMGILPSEQLLLKTESHSPRNVIKASMAGPAHVDGFLLGPEHNSFLHDEWLCSRSTLVDPAHAGLPRHTASTSSCVRGETPMMGEETQ